jgi:hypothetical protein
LDDLQRGEIEDPIGLVESEVVRGHGVLKCWSVGVLECRVMRDGGGKILT